MSQKTNVSEATHRRRSKRRAEREKAERMSSARKRAGIDQMPDEEIPAFYDRTYGMVGVGGLLLLILGGMVIFGAVRGQAFTFPGILASLPIEVVLIIAGLLVFGYLHEPGSYVVMAVVLAMSLVPRLLLREGSWANYWNLVLGVLVFYFMVQFMVFRKARARYLALPADLSKPGRIPAQEIAPLHFPIIGLVFGLAGAACLGLALAGVGPTFILDAVAPWFAVIGLAFSAASLVGDYDRLPQVVTIAGAVASGAVVAAWVAEMVRLMLA